MNDRSATPQPIMQCPHCGTGLFEQAPRCRNCGKELVASYPRPGPIQLDPSTVKAIAKAMNNICALFWIVANILYLISAVSQFATGTLNPSNHDQAYLYGRMFGGAFEVILIIYLIATALGMMRYRRAARQSAVAFSWIGSVLLIGLLFSIAYSIYDGMGAGEWQRGADWLFPSFYITLVGVTMTFLTRWSIRATKPLEVDR